MRSRPEPTRRVGTILQAVAALTLLGLPGRPAQADGTVLPSAPTVAPGTVPGDPDHPLPIARDRWHQGDVAGVVTILSPWLESRRAPYGRERTAGHLLLGLAHMERERWNLASTHFYQVRKTDDPLAPWGAWYEAVVDHHRGRHSVAIRECEQYRERFPDGLHADECLVLMGEAWAAMGHPRNAVAAYETWLEHNPDTPRSEEIALAKAIAVARSQPTSGIPMLQELVLVHTFPSTALGAQQVLDELAAEGLDTALPDDPWSQARRATSLRRSGKLVEAWELFEQISAQAEAVDGSGAPADARLQAWVDDNEETFAWGTRRFDVWVDAKLPEYEAHPGARLGWRIFRALARGGMYVRAADWGQQMQQEWGERSEREAVAWALMHAGDYAAARERFLDLGAGGGKSGRDARFRAAFCAWRAAAKATGEARTALLETAVAELGEQVEGNSADPAMSAWWLSRALDDLGRPAEAAAARRKAAELDERGWYRLLVNQHDWKAAGSPMAAPAADARTDTDRWLVRDGRWGGHHPPELALGEPARTDPKPATASWPVSLPLVEVPVDRRDPDGATTFRRGLLVPDANPGWSQLRWTGTVVPASPAAPPPGIETVAMQLPISQEPLPDGFGACTWFDPDAAATTFEGLSDRYADVLPELPAAWDLTRAGLSVDAGRLLNQAWARWDAAKGRTDPQSQRIRTIKMTDWREITTLAREPHLSYRLCIGLSKYAENEQDRLDALRLAYPMVRTPELWAHGRNYGVDPFLMMGIMRQESRYQATVVSHAGAVGLVQVMPRTGAKVAALLGEGRYSPSQLEDPETNLRYGAYYMSLLIRRFDGVFPLAIASYNGGPHNMSRWYKPWRDRGEVPELDVFVEHIEYDESRDYVKKVTGYYADYVALYGPPGARVVLPETLAGDDASLVDF
ncbi:MAG: transglycosylase SLT domain-containing protein [Alphaproteobacteria bacterium]|nr:transglycosylase SLT domain-containing protein [Alphaproteobacteria bacterium]